MSTVAVGVKHGSKVLCGKSRPKKLGGGGGMESYRRLSLTARITRDLGPQVEFGSMCRDGLSMDLRGPFWAYDQDQSSEAQMPIQSWVSAIQGTADGNRKLWMVKIMPSPKLYMRWS
jgi:hypothetical protein